MGSCCDCVALAAVILVSKQRKAAAIAIACPDRAKETEKRLKQTGKGATKNSSKVKEAKDNKL